MSDVDDWMTQAESDNSVVAEILLRLRQPQPQPPPLVDRKLEWSVRQRRSRPAVLVRKNEEKPTRASPSTPLSWSDGNNSLSTSGGGGGGVAVEETSLDGPTTIGNVRSKLAVANESINTKRSRRKKTLAQLRDEESFLLDERRELRSKLTSVYRKIEELRGSNENLKKMKSEGTLKIASSPVASEETISDQLQQMDADKDQECSNSATSAIFNNSNLSLAIKSPKVERETSCKEYSFVLPDLNLPFEDGSEPSIFNRIS
ncbi:hypothetical protein ACFE04_014146 [Oxalis oulophora]